MFPISRTTQNLAWGALGAFAGAAADRWGAGRVVFGAALAYAAGDPT